MLEYLQGILFLTTNRVQTFDEAFQSRIHIGLRYGKLDIKTKKDIWKGFVDRVRALLEDDFTKLSKFEVNGREVQELLLIFLTLRFYVSPLLTFMDRLPHMTS